MTYPGGKEGAGVYQRIINQFPPHQLYIEPFLGGGAILRLKRPAIASIGIDIDPDVINAFSDDEISNLTLICTDAISWLSDHHAEYGATDLIYLDPPYLMSTRRQQHRLYRCELGDLDHLALLKTIKELTCSIAISGYPSRMYENELAGWRKISFPARTRGGAMATECLWMNYPEPLELHEYTYLGENFRQRERIKRKIARWKNRLERMNRLERQAMLAAITEMGWPASPEKRGCE